jgi:hypothetical protein
MMKARGRINWSKWLKLYIFIIKFQQYSLEDKLQTINQHHIYREMNYVINYNTLTRALTTKLESS